MATETLYPNSTNCGGYKGFYATHPGTTAIWEAKTALDATDKNAASTDDASYLDQGNGGVGGVEEAGVMFYYKPAAGTITQIDVASNQNDGGGADTALYIWNDDTPAFETLDTHTGGAPGEYTLSGSKTANLTNYIDGNGNINVLCGNVNAPGTHLLIDQCKVTVTLSDGTSSSVAFLGINF